MSSSQSFSYSSTSYSSVSSSSSGSNGQSHSQRYTQQSHSNSRDGTTSHRRYEETGKPTIEKTTQVPAGRQLGRDAAGNERRIEDVTDEEQQQQQRDKEYEERMEDEYAKREGGA